MSVKERKDITEEEILYEFYSLDSLKYLINMLSQLKLSLQKILPKNDPLYEKKVLIFRFEIIARYCQLAESLGGLILGYKNLNITSNKQLNNKHIQQVLKFLSQYTINDIDTFYKNVENNIFPYDVVFGYDLLDTKYQNDPLIVTFELDTEGRVNKIGNVNSTIIYSVIALTTIVGIVFIYRNKLKLIINKKSKT